MTKIVSANVNLSRYSISYSSAYTN